MGCNTILGYIDKVSGSQEVKNNLCGQAYVLRAYYYFLLVNYYGMPYNVGDPKTNLGVPLKLVMDVNDGFMKRNTVAEVYDQIVKDLEVGIQLLEEHPKDMSLYKINALAGEAILCRVYLYMEDWDHALEYANKVLKKKPTLLSFASMPTGMMEPGFMGPTWSVYNLSVSDEIIWMYGDIKHSHLVFHPCKDQSRLSRFPKTCRICMNIMIGGMIPSRVNGITIMAICACPHIINT